MTTYNIQKEITITRQEGDSSDLSINVPEILDITGATAIFQVRSMVDKIILSKSIIPQGQQINCLFNPQDTEGKAGIHRWELELIWGERHITIGRGNFEIIKQLIK